MTPYSPPAYLGVHSAHRFCRGPPVGIWFSRAAGDSSAWQAPWGEDIFSIAGVTGVADLNAQMKLSEWYVGRAYVLLQEVGGLMHCYHFFLRHRDFSFTGGAWGLGLLCSVWHGLACIFVVLLVTFLK